MIKVKIKKAYSNEYAIIYPIDYLVLNNIYYYLVLIANKDGIVYDTILLPPDKYSISEQMFTIYHASDTPEIFTAVTMK